MREDQRLALIDAYLRERAGYERRGLPDRVAQVDAELKKLGHTSAPVNRQAPPAETAETNQPARRTRVQRA